MSALESAEQDGARDALPNETLKEIACRAAEVVLAVREVAPLPRLALKPGEAAAALGTSWDYFNDHVAPELRWVRRGRLKLVAVAELARWLEREAELTLPEAR